MSQEHTPMPLAGRSFYGFFMFFIGISMGIAYISWTLIPHYYLKQIGITYLPQPDWALVLPSLFIVFLMLFVFFIYPSINLLLTVPPDDIHNIEDCYTIRKEDHPNLHSYSIPPIYDEEASEFCKRLYSI